MSKVDWSKAPADAQFYSCEYFRKHEDGKEFCWVGLIWYTDGFDSLEWHKKRDDFEMRPHSVEWNGEGLPPVGTVCEHHSGRKYEVTGYANQDTEMPDVFPVTIIYRNTDTGKVWCRPFEQWKASFKPVKSDRDKWVDECAKILSNEHIRVTDTVKNLFMFKGEASAIYDALKSGKLPTP